MNNISIRKYITSFIIIALLFGGCEKDEISNLTNGKTTAVFNLKESYGSMTDQDGNEYKTITIGSQTWMAENLRTTKYRDGSEIIEVTVNSTWSLLTKGAYCNFNNTKNLDTIATYGRLYNWYAVSDSRNLAPNGWHVPTNQEWIELTDYLGGENIAGGKLKEADSTHWLIPNTGATNESGFTALPGGIRLYNATFYGFGRFGSWWCATEYETNLAWHRLLYHNGLPSVGSYTDDIHLGFSVRCVKD